MADGRLHLFLSYAIEDRDLALAIAEELRRTFNPAVFKLTIDVDFKLGANWRTQLKADLDDTDILLVVATGRQKASHSFTGFEVGYFDASIKHSRKMASFPTQDRFMLPIAVLTRTPETLADIEALQIDDPVLVDPAALKNPAAPSKIGNGRDPILKLFKRIQGILNPPNLTDEDLEAFNGSLHISASRLTSIIHDELRKRVYLENFPERKIVIRTPNAEGRSGGLLADSTVEFFGHFDAFGFDAPEAGKPIPWAGFVAGIAEEDVARCWADTVQMLVTAAIRGDFRENRQTVTSRERDRAFRMFVARSIIFYSGVHEIHIYIFEIKHRDFGDPTTSMLLKAISVGSQYHFMFLEGKASEYSPEAFNATLQDELRGKIAEMIQQLDYLLWYSRDAGLRKPGSILHILGDVKPGEIEKRAAAWDAAKAKLFASAQTVLGSKSDQELLQNKIQFVRVLKAFCDSTRVWNEDFTAKVMIALGAAVGGKDAPPMGKVA
ncbi:MAG TPA: toll/interleukin-1 receptor domain-containing protein [Bradyrhizobium sp.]|uniref:toll/interleukin-1 receptor domain-containing protein n=1 Tax=Bradyrhizobium sp. TaxID=376 RepID=UPI002C72F32C|nr:toll/interleukin-1 receptor domain-containing protein [Bradyrhizobium sp.]HLZ02523.1 toll/interleukin-1 receptor domain-containing protein [Bradyrhizobium sp.]